MKYNTQPIAEVMDAAIKRLKVMKNTSQKAAIRNYLENGGKLTAMAALNFWGCWNLKGRIWDIKQDYWREWGTFSSNNIDDLQEIDKTMVKTSTGKWVAEYFLVKDD